MTNKVQKTINVTPLTNRRLMKRFEEYNKKNVPISFSSFAEYILDNGLDNTEINIKTHE